MRVSIAIACVFTIAAHAEQRAPTGEQLEFFETKVRPVLAENCYGCHGPDKQKADLRLDARRALLEGGESGPAIAPGDPDNSKLIAAVHQNGDLSMPPDGKLTAAEIEALTNWIAMGAPWPEAENDDDILTMGDRFAHAREKHWAFQPVRRPDLPATQQTDWPQQELDHFILAKLEETGLTPSDQADPRALLRRLNYDLTGLPPTFEEVDAFQADPSPRAYEATVDLLLASPQFGERWARYWLDLARYSDTKGYVFQQDRNFPFSHTYRDYVIRAFNDDLPYNEFIKDQLAADQLEREDKRRLAGMGILSLGRNFVGNIHDQTDDRIDVITRGMMGLTVSCARCHDHKYDPITQADYYALYGVFRSSVDPGELPLIEEPDEDDPQYQDFVAKVAEKETDLAQHTENLHLDILAKARAKVGDYLLAGHDVRAMDDTEALRTLARDRDLLWQLVERWRDHLKTKAEGDGPYPVLAPWLAFAALPEEGFAEQAADLAKRIAENKDAAYNPLVAKKFEGDPPASMADVAQRYGALLQEIDKSWTDRLAGRAQRALKSDTPYEVPTALPDPSAEQVRQLLYSPNSPANVPEGDVWNLSPVPIQNTIRDRRNGIAKLKATHPGRPDRAMVVTDAAQLFEPYVFLRGKPGSKGDPVPRRFMEVFAKDTPPPFEQGSGRRELAEQIASPENPLTARVFVNRVWLQLMGKPLVNTPSDFGLRSDPPSHPELLDWLARDFMDNGWSMKRLIRQIVLSSTYRQSSAANDTGLEKDPENKLLWRQNRERLDFEAMRDSILAAAGTLDLTLGGHSVEITEKPYPTRRTLYSRIERQNLPGVFRTFDLALPDTHSPMRFQTTVPQQALYFMNGEFAVEQAQTLAARAAESSPDEDALIDEFYKTVYQRPATLHERIMARDFLEQTAIEAPAPSPWAYGTIEHHPDTGEAGAFTELPHYSDGAWKGGPDLPASTYGWASWNRNGGHPGDRYDAVLRWTAPISGTIEIDGRLNHPSDKGDGVIGIVYSSRHGQVWAEPVRHTTRRSHIKSLTVQPGDTLDFIVQDNANTSFDGFKWDPTIQQIGGNAQQWSAETQFHGPTPQPLTPRQQYAQVLLMSNEFLFVD